MKQILQNLRSGQTAVTEVPAPQARPGHVVIQTRASLISAGTERMLVEFGQASLLAKARAQPDKVRQVLDKIRTDGLLPTLDAVFNRLDEPLPLGYCNAGVILQVGPGVTKLKPGDRVASNGPHAEVVVVPQNLCARIPDEVSDDEAAFTVLSSIGLQGIRLVQPQLGERVVVYGLGLIGLVALQLLKASGCETLGVDVSEQRLSMAADLGAATVNPAAGGDALAKALAFSEGKGVDAVLVTASAKTDEIIHNAATMCRKRGRIVLVGVVGLNLRRSDFYEKELSFQVSCSYGPGRYDEEYELRGIDYPLGFVRFTEQRNFQAVLGAMRSGQLDVAPLISDRFSLAEAANAYERIKDRSALGVILQYPETVDLRATIESKPPRTPGIGPPTGAVVGIIGAGNFSKMTLLPALSRAKAQIAKVADLNGAAAQHLAQKFGAGAAVTDYRQILDDPDIRAVLIAVGHELHAQMVCECLGAGKHVFVEKPLAMSPEEILQVLETARQHPSLLVTVGFNRRFSPHIEKARHLLAQRSEPLAMSMTVNAGAIPPGHWVHDPRRGGGRIIGEACHFIDLLAFIAKSPVEHVSSAMMGSPAATPEDKMSIILTFGDGSIGTVNYFANGSKAYPKERLEVFSEGRVLEVSNFRRTTGFGFRGFSKLRTSRQDKGHRQQFRRLVEVLERGGEELVPLSESVNATLASFAAMAAAEEHRTVRLTEEYAALADMIQPGRLD